MKIIKQSATSVHIGSLLTILSQIQATKNFFFTENKIFIEILSLRQYYITILRHNIINYPLRNIII